MRKLFVFLLVVLPLLTFSQNERALLEKDIYRFIEANNSMDCHALVYYTPRLVFVETTENELLYNCEREKWNRSEYMKKSMNHNFVLDTLVISDGSKYAKLRIPTDVVIEFADAEATEEFHSDAFYYRLIEAYCKELLDRSNIGELFVDHENHKVYYSCLVSVLALWEEGHWTFLKQEGSEELPPLDVLDPDILYQ